MILDSQVAEVQHEINALERPSTAVKASYLAQEEDMDEKGKAKWMGERDEKLAELKQLESKAYNLSRELKNKAKQQASEMSQLKFQLHSL